MNIFQRISKKHIEKAVQAHGWKKILLIAGAIVTAGAAAVSGIMWPGEPKPQGSNADEPQTFAGNNE